MSTDHDWEAWGATDPYFGVLSADRFRQRNLSEQSRDEFFRSGEDHVAMIFETINRAFGSGFTAKRTLDFGCGVGRLLIPFARRNTEVVGVDVSQSMLREAQANCLRYQVSDVSLVLSDDTLSAVEGEFDLVHSCLVLQHVPWKRGKRLIRELLHRVKPGGVIAIQFYYYCNASSVLRAFIRLRYASGAISALRNLWRGNLLSEPAMQLHVYDLSSITRCLRQSGFTMMYQYIGDVAGGTFESTLLFAQRRSSA